MKAATYITQIRQQVAEAHKVVTLAATTAATSRAVAVRTRAWGLEP
jgi:hypothetical protein